MIRNVIDAYYLFRKDEGNRTGYSCSEGSFNYPELDRSQAKRTGFIKVYKLDSEYVNARKGRKPDYAISGSGASGHLSSVYQPNPKEPFAWGDMKGTNDLLLFHSLDNWQSFELFVLKGRKHEFNIFMNLFVDGQLTEDMDRVKISIQIKKAG